MEPSLFRPEWRGFFMPSPYPITTVETKAEVKQISTLYRALSPAQIFRIRHEDETPTTALFAEVLEKYGFKVKKPLFKKCERIEEELKRIAAHYQQRFKRADVQATFRKNLRRLTLPTPVSSEEHPYPSSRALVGCFLAQYLSTWFPKATPTLEEYGKQIGWNRVRAGWSHPSDYAMGRLLAEHLWKHFNAEGLK